jgi:hypothetical protein
MVMDIKEEEVGIKPPMGPKKWGVQSPKKKVIGDALLNGKRGSLCEEKV